MAKARVRKGTIGSRGDAIYQEKIRPHLKKADHGKFVAIDVNTGEYEISEDLLTACDRLAARVPEPLTWSIRVGSKALFSFGGQRLEEST